MRGIRFLGLVLCGWISVAMPQQAREPEGADAFSAAVDGIMPLSPVEIRRLREVVETKQRAIHDVVPPSSTTLKTLSVSLQAGALTPLITLLSGHAVGIEIVDRYAAPWPVVSYTVGDPQRYHVTVPDVADVNVLTITPQTSFGRSNLVLQLQGESTPISLTLNASTRVEHFHDRVSVLVDAVGPNAELPPGDMTVAVEDSTLLGVLDGVPPQSSIRLQPSNALVRGAWRHQDTLWLRGRFELLSPAFRSQVAGAGEMMAYELSWTPSVIALDRQGNSHNVKLETESLLQ